MVSPTFVRWSLLIALLLAVVLVPFALIGEPIEAWTDSFLRTAADHPLSTALVLGGLLISDILLPIPSSIVSTSAGYLLGFIGGTITSFLGMTLGSVCGYWLGSSPGHALTRRLVGKEELERMRRLHERFGDRAIVLARPIPVLAEISTFFAGIAGMPFRRFLLLAALSNLGVSLAYAAVGAYSATVDSFLVAFAGAILLPAIGLIAARLIAGRSRR